MHEKGLSSLNVFVEEIMSVSACFEIKNLWTQRDHRMWHVLLCRLGCGPCEMMDRHHFPLPPATATPRVSGSARRLAWGGVHATADAGHDPGNNLGFALHYCGPDAVW